ncbi:MAG: VWA domain-containing protein [Chloroflexi bacterium]|nr:VWA domain-containing protein [Chloroflexota bacterium]
MAYLFRYARWDGTQRIFELDQDTVMDELSEDLLAHGDVQRALRNMFQRGIRGREGDSQEGLRQLRERLRQRRQENLDRYNLNSVFKDIQEKLQNIVKKEREGIDRRVQESRQQAAENADLEPQQKQKLLDMMEQRANRNRERLDQLPENPGGMIKDLSSYDFMDDEARQEFQDLLDSLKKQMMQNYFQNMKQQLQSLTPQDMSALRDMLKDLNQMLQDKMMGREPNFQGFMDKWGQMFGDNRPQSLEELMEQMARQMGQMQSLMDSMSPEMRRELEQMMESLLDEATMDELAQLGMAMEQLFPMDDLRGQYPFMGQDDMTLEEAMRLMGTLQGMDELERQLQDVMSQGNIADLDLDKVQELLGEEARRAVEELQRVTQMLEDAGYIKRKGDKLELAPRGIRKIGQKALREVFSQLKKGRIGQHELHDRGLNGEDTGDTKLYEFGDPFDVDLRRSIMNAVERSGPQVPVHMTREDFEIHRREQITEAATCLLLDQSRSMGMFGSFLAAKKVALALYTLTHSQFPRDKLWVIGFSDYAVQLKGEDLPEVTWNAWVSGTNLHHAFMVSRQLLSREKAATRQIIVITDGEPTAHIEGSRAYFAYPPSHRTIQETLKEVKRCTEAGIVINTFMLESSYYLLHFVDQMTRINRGRAFYTNPDKLGEFVLVDYLNNRRKRVV